jgi:hypothetical protein
MRRPGIWLSLFLFLILSFLSPVFALHPCRCNVALNPATDTMVSGGGPPLPLTWRSAQRLHHVAIQGRASESRCYEREVHNISLLELTLVKWAVAGYEKEKIPPKTPMCDPIEILGPLTNEPPSGQLIFGPSGRGASTQVYAPQAGWPKKMAILSEPLPFVPGGPPVLLSLSSGVSIPNRAHFNSAALVSLTSTVENLGAGTGYRYSYTVSQDSQDPVQVVWSVIIPENLVLRDDLSKDFVIAAKNGIVVLSGQTITFSHLSSEPPKWGVGPVIVKDRSGKTLISRGIGSSYGPLNGVLREVE